jgi:hypothetical protein
MAEELAEIVLGMVHGIRSELTISRNACERLKAGVEF